MNKKTTTHHSNNYFASSAVLNYHFLMQLSFEIIEEYDFDYFFYNYYSTILKAIAPSKKFEFIQCLIWSIDLNQKFYLNQSNLNKKQKFFLAYFLIEKEPWQFVRNIDKWDSAEFTNQQTKLILNKTLFLLLSLRPINWHQYLDKLSRTFCGIFFKQWVVILLKSNTFFSTKKEKNYFWSLLLKSYDPLWGNKELQQQFNKNIKKLCLI